MVEHDTIIYSRGIKMKTSEYLKNDYKETYTQP